MTIKTILHKLDRKFLRLKNQLDDLYYEARGLIHPYNVIKIQNLRRTWNDRDDVLFHGVFQVLVDYIELEQPYINWDKQVPGRLLDVNIHEEGMKNRYDPERQTAEELEGENGPGRRYYEQGYADNLVIFGLYKWYKDREWDKEFLDYTLERAHHTFCSDKLIEVIKYRAHYWS